MFHPEEKILKQKAVQDFKTEIYIDFITILPFKNLLLFCKSICKVRLLKTSRLGSKSSGHCRDAELSLQETAQMFSTRCSKYPWTLFQIEDDLSFFKKKSLFQSKNQYPDPFLLKWHLCQAKKLWVIKGTFKLRNNKSKF